MHAKGANRPFRGAARRVPGRRTRPAEPSPAHRPRFGHLRSEAHPELPNARRRPFRDQSSHGATRTGSRRRPIERTTRSRDLIPAKSRVSPTIDPPRRAGCPEPSGTTDNASVPRASARRRHRAAIATAHSPDMPPRFATARREGVFRRVPPCSSAASVQMYLHL